MSKQTTATLNTGQKIPVRGYGTWLADPGEVGAGVIEALKAGYRHLDLAAVYMNQREVGDALKKAFKEMGLKREDLWITSKIWNTHHTADRVPKALDATLTDLGIDYLDLYLIHWPVSFQYRGEDETMPVDKESNDQKEEVALDNSTSIIDTWKAMTQLPKEKTRAVGVSNYTSEHIEAVIKGTGVVPSANEIERHPLLPQPELIDFCAQKGIHIISYSPLGNNVIGLPLLISRPEVKQVAERLSKQTGSEVTGAQVLLAWAQVGGHSVIPKSVTLSRIHENFKEIELSKEDIDTINSMGNNPRRFNIPHSVYEPLWNVNIFGDESEKTAKYGVIM